MGIASAGHMMTGSLPHHTTLASVPFRMMSGRTSLASAAVNRCVQLRRRTLRRSQQLQLQSRRCSTARSARQASQAQQSCSSILQDRCIARQSSGPHRKQRSEPQHVAASFLRLLLMHCRQLPGLTAAAQQR